MADRDQRRTEAAKHLALMKGAFAKETEAAVAAARIYEEGEAVRLELPEAAFDATATRVTTDFAPKAVFSCQGKVAVVDPVSFTRPGGAYEDGSFGPEQLLCSQSNLYPVLCGLKDSYHSANRGYARGQLFTDRAFYLDDIVFLRDGDVRHAAVIGIPEPNRTRALENHRSERESDRALAGRIQALLCIAAANGVESLVVGAFGCGRQGYADAQAIEAFQSWIAEHPGALREVVFAVPRASFDAFNEAFGQPEPEEAAPAAADAAGEGADSDKQDGDDFDWTRVELPEGVTIR